MDQARTPPCPPPPPGPGDNTSLPPGPGDNSSLPPGPGHNTSLPPLLYAGGRYASYWNAFLLWNDFTLN